MGVRIDSLNEMLDQIQSRDSALTEASEQLEMRGQERTVELTSEIAERKLAESKLGLTQFSIDNSSDSVLRINSNGKIVYGNTAACNIYGYSREELLERYIWDIDLNFSRNGWEDRRQDVRQKGTVVFESLSRTKTGKVFPAEVSLLYIEFEGCQYICAFSRDISERKRIEEARIKQVERIKRQESAIVRISTNQSLNIGSIRDAMQVITEITADTMRVDRVSVWLLNNDRTQLDCVDLFERSTQMHSCGMKLLASDYPRYFTSLTMGRTIDVSDACTDPRTSEFAKEYMIPLGIISMLDTVIRVSGDIVGVVCHESVGHKRIWNPDEITFAGEIADQAAQTMINADRKEAQGELEDVNNQLQTTVQKLEEANQELKNFVYIASHDLREPLRKISAFGAMLQKSLTDKITGDDSENLNFMIDGATRMTKMIEGLLAYSRVNTKTHSAEKVNLNDTVKEIGQLELSVAIEEKKAVIDVPQPLPEVEVDPVQIRQLMQNLIANGMKYQAKDKDIVPHITITSKPAADGMVRINVIDNGIGIASEFQQAIFIMFKRLHSRNEYEGTGIGLAVCKKIVERHGGQIGVESQPGKGSTFWFTVPEAKIGTKESKSELETSFKESK
jgi:PAS domain S-box-containing protein